MNTIVPTGTADPGRPVPTVDRRFRGLAVLAFLARPAPAATLLFGALLLLASNVNGVLGPRAVAFKHFYAHGFMLFVVVAGCCRLYVAPPAVRQVAARAALRALPWFLLFCALIGVHGLVSNGVDYQRMATDYWDADPFNATSRRIGLPALAHVLGLEGRAYTVLWYAVLFPTFTATMRLLDARQLSSLEALSVLSSSILAYALVGPGYGDILVLLLGLLAVQCRLGPVDRIAVATLMIATHETMTPFVAAGIVLAADRDDRREWIAVFGLLYLAFTASYALTWHRDLAGAVIRADRPSPGAEHSVVDLVRLHPGLATLGAVMAYKLYWLPVVMALRRRGAWPMAVAALASLPLILLGSDTSRLVQFSSLALFLAVSTELGTWPTPARRALAIANLVVPSLYVAVNAGLLWGPGLYSVYLRGAEAAGLQLGRVFWQ